MLSCSYCRDEDRCLDHACMASVSAQQMMRFASEKVQQTQHIDILWCSNTWQYRCLTATRGDTGALRQHMVWSEHRTNKQAWRSVHRGSMSLSQLLLCRNLFEWSCVSEQGGKSHLDLNSQQLTNGI